MAKILISGSGGFLGGHLIDILSPQHELVGADLVPAPGGVDCPWVQVPEPHALGEVLYKERPEFFVHGAFVNRCPAEQSTQAYLDEMLATNLPCFHAAAELGIKMLLLSSSAVYGRAQGRQVIDEDCPREPVSLYGIAKNTQELFASQVAETSGLQLLTLRPFNLCGPGQKPGMLLPDWVSQAAGIAAGGEPHLKVFNLATSRDFTDVRDAARAIALLLADFRPGEVVNVASGHATALTHIMDLLKGHCPRPFEVEQTQAERSAVDVLRQQGSFDRIQQGWGWSPQIPFEQSLADLWQEWQR